MNYSLIFKVGLKVCIAAAAGLAIYLGIDKVSGSGSGKKQEKIEGGPKNTGMENLSSNEPVEEGGVVDKMRNVQGTLGKLFACAQAVTIAVENFKKVFSGPGESGCYAGTPYYYGGNPFYNNGYGGGYRNPDLGPDFYYSRNNNYSMNRMSPNTTGADNFGMYGRV